MWQLWRFLWVCSFLLWPVVISIAVILSPITWILFDRLVVEDVLDWMDSILSVLV